VFLDFNLLGGDVEASHPERKREKALSPLFYIELFIPSDGGLRQRYLLLDVPITLSSSLWGGDQTLKGSQSSLEQKNTTPSSLEITLSVQLPVV